ncbi:hypothetical protein [Arthrobacter sp. NPDC058192]|uniref:hypothetical protein n=1 Tax=Arthrobacter sp. NPDC058192 TaxID=3346372 RepID=UPI0036E5347A
MPLTHNVDWDGRLESFRGRDTPLYVKAAAAVATACALCGQPLQPGEPLSLSVEIIESTAPNGTEHVIFSDSVCHRHCREPDLAVRRAVWAPTRLTPTAAHITFTREPGAASPGVSVAALAYTLAPVVEFREADGELTSALVSLLLSNGFQLAMDPAYTEMLNHARELGDGCSLTVTGAAFLTLNIGGETVYAEQLNPETRANARWMEAARKGNVLVISGDNLVITEHGLDVAAAAQLGTLVIGFVPFRNLT